MTDGACDISTVKVVDAVLEDPPDDPVGRLYAAKKLAETIAGEGCFLLSWKNGLTGEAHPDTAACGCTTIEGWEQYAMTRGADLRVRINGGDYEFMFISGESGAV